MTDLAHDKEEALRLLDAILAAKPKRDAAQFSDCVRALVRMRDGLAGNRLREERSDGGTHGSRGQEDGSLRFGRDDNSLGGVNATISAVLGGEFPKRKIPWEMLEAARRTLATLDVQGART